MLQRLLGPAALNAEREILPGQEAFLFEVLSQEEGGVLVLFHGCNDISDFWDLQGGSFVARVHR